MNKRVKQIKKIKIDYENKTLKYTLKEDNNFNEIIKFCKDNYSLENVNFDLVNNFSKEKINENSDFKKITEIIIMKIKNNDKSNNINELNENKKKLEEENKEYKEKVNELNENKKKLEEKNKE